MWRPGIPFTVTKNMTMDHYAAPSGIGGLSSGADGSLSRINREINSLLDGVDRDVFDRAGNGFIFLGKAVRSRFTLLLGDSLGLGREEAERICVAAELVHTASLMHDDCIDRAELRRGFPTLNASLGFNAAVLLGDLIVAIAFDHARTISQDCAASLVGTVRRMAEGALLEENFRYKRISAAEAERVVRLKTGELFRWCALAASELSGRGDLYGVCGTIGAETGAVFQIIDDVLDFEGEPEMTGKAGLKDIAEGKATLPLILALNDPRYADGIEAGLASLKAGAADPSLAPRIAGIIKDNGFAAGARALAERKVRALDRAVARLPVRAAAGELRDYLRSLSDRKN